MPQSGLEPRSRVPVRAFNQFFRKSASKGKKVPVCLFKKRHVLSTQFRFGISRYNVILLYYIDKVHRKSMETFGIKQKKLIESY